MSKALTEDDIAKIRTAAVVIGLTAAAVAWELGGYPITAGVGAAAAWILVCAFASSWKD